jgi:CheY-like chemotaxis protein
MDNPIQELNKIRRQLMSQEKPKKLKILVVDDEPDNLDLLYRTFRRDFNVLKADSGVQALDILATEGEVAVIISDQRMPEMKGTEFLSKTLPQFPDTVRIILTGFTDIEDLVEAINAGQVYKYITKPWDPGELKAVVQRAAETYDLLKQRTEELRRANTQTALLTHLVYLAQTASSIEAILTPITKAFGETFTTTNCVLQLVEGSSLVATHGCYSPKGSVDTWLSQDPLTADAIASQEIQVVANVTNDERLVDSSDYKKNGIQTHLVIPMIYRKEVLGVLSMQWEKLYPLREDELQLIHSCAQLLAIAFTCTRYHQPKI